MNSWIICGNFFSSVSSLKIVNKLFKFEKCSVKASLTDWKYNWVWLNKLVLILFFSFVWLSNSFSVIVISLVQLSIFSFIKISIKVSIFCTSGCSCW